MGRGLETESLPHPAVPVGPQDVMASTALLYEALQVERSRTRQLGVAITAALLLLPITFFAGKSDQVIAVDKAGRVISTVRASAELDDATITNFCADSVAEIWTISYAELALWARRARPRFNDAGWTAFNNAMNARGKLNAIATYSQTITTQRDGVCQIYQSDTQHRKWWRVKIPVLIRTESGGKGANESRAIDLYMERSTDPSSEFAIRITSWNEVPR